MAKKQKLKKRISLAIRALKGAPLIEDYPMPPLKVERTPVQTIRAHYEISRQEFDLVGRDIATEYVKPRLLSALVGLLNDAGLVQACIERRDYDRVVFHASIKVVEPYKED